jgi:virginiamycin B lyase
MMSRVRRLVPTVAVLLALCAALAPGAGAATPQLVQLPHGTTAEALALGPGGELWFAGTRRGADAGVLVGSVAADGSIEEYAVPNSASTPGVGGLALGPEGDMWFTEPEANRVERVAPGGHPEGFTLPRPGSRPTGIVRLGDSLWVTLPGVGAITRVKPVGEENEFTLSPGRRPTALTVGPEGFLWVIDGAAAEVTRKAPDGRSIGIPFGGEFAGTRNTDIVSGPDGDLWLSQSDGPYIGRLEARVETTEYTRFQLPLPGGTSLVSNGPRHDIWFAGGGRIGSIDTKGASFGMPVCPVRGCPTVKALVEGPGGALWFAAGGVVGRFDPPPLAVFPRGHPVPTGVKRATARLACVGGAAGQRCQGKVEILGRGGGKRLGSGRFDILTSRTRPVALRLTQAGAVALARHGSLGVRLVARLGGKVAFERDFRLGPPR